MRSAVPANLRTTAGTKRDNGSDFYFQGEAHDGWTEDDIEPLKDVPASAFEAIVPGPLEE